ncbi:MAG: HD-GYP domain-containing protein [Gemmatimonadota bacterium]
MRPITDREPARTAGDGSSIATSEVIAALSRALDLTGGQPLGHSVRTCIIGMRLGECLGLGEDELAQLYYALLLKDAGCTSNASRMAALFGSDDRLVKQRMKMVDWDDRIETAIHAWRSTGLRESLGNRVAHFVEMARQQHTQRDLIEARCERGADIAHRLGFPDGTVDAIRCLDEHWNGKGYPAGMSGEEIPLLSRIINLAQTVEVFIASGSVEDVEEVLRARRGRWFDPRLTDEILNWSRDSDFWRLVRSDDAESFVQTLEPRSEVRTLDERGLDQVAQSFADIIDAKSPFTYRHSSQVSLYACAIGRQLGFDAESMARTRRAGLLHDIGKVGVSNLILEKKGGLSEEERREVERHPVFTWEILSRVPAFAGFARQAATHHEKLDGSGYPWGLRATDLDMPARVMVVADIYEALTADRPYRSGLSQEESLAILGRQRGTRIDGDAIDALAAALENDEVPAEF